MSKVDDELTRRFRRVERRVDIDGLFEGLEQRRSHRERVRKVQASALAFAVLAGSVAGFVALRSVFLGDDRTTGDLGVPLSSNGEIVFVKDGLNSRLHVYAARSDGSGERELTSGPTNDSHPAASPDGRTIAFVHALDGDGGEVVATMPMAGGEVTWQTAEYYGVTDPAWSPDGTQIAFIGHSVSSADLFVADVHGNDATRIDLVAAAGYEPNEIRAFTPSHPTWSPDGRWIAFAGVIESDAPRSSDLAMIHPDGSGFERLPAEGGPDEFAPAWSPDGTRIAFLRAPEALGNPEEFEQGGGPNEIWTISPDGGPETLIATAVESSLGLDLDWAPDGSALLVSDHDWLYRVDPAPDGDVRDNFAQLFRGFAPSWQPIPTGVQPSPEPSPSPSPAPGRDIGLGFPLCNLETLGDIDWYGESVSGTAWTGARTTPDGRCPQENTGEYVVVADLDGDGQAEPGGMGFLNSCLLCRPYATTDLDANGVLELVVLEEASSTPSYSFYEVSVPTSERSPGIYNLFVAPPGHEPAGLRAGEPLRVDAGGDEGYSSQIECVDGADGRELVWGWSNQPVDSGERKEVHVARIQLQPDGLFHVIGSEDYTVAAGEPSGLAAGTAPSCGVDWHPAA